MTMMLWAISDIVGAAFVTFWPSVYRNVIAPLFPRAWEALEADNQISDRSALSEEVTDSSPSESRLAINAEALFKFRQDLDLVTISTLLGLANLVRLSLFFYFEDGHLPIWTASGFIVSIGPIGWLYYLHRWSDVREYVDINSTAVSPFGWLGPPLGRIRERNPSGLWASILNRIRVTGVVARRIFWTRIGWAVLTLLIGLLISSEEVWDWKVFGLPK